MSLLICQECRVGRYRPLARVYIYWVGQQIISFPNAPAFVCDVCKHTYYDTHFLNSMEFLLDELTAEHPAAAQEKMQQSVTEQSPGWQTTRSR